MPNSSSPGPSIYTGGFFDTRYQNPMYNQSGGYNYQPNGGLSYSMVNNNLMQSQNGGAATLAPGPVSGYSPAYGGVPSVPNPTSTQTSSILGNIGNLGSLYGLSQGTGAASGAGALAQLNNNLPGATGAMGTALGNTNSLLSGAIPGDVLRQLQQSSAENAAATGMGSGSPAIESSLLRSMGLTSLGLQQTGLQNLGSLIGMTPKGPEFNPSSMLVDPSQMQGAQYAANVLGAAPIPSAAAAANLAALRNGQGQGRGATAPPALDPNASTGGPGSGALGFGFGTLGSLQAPPKTLTGALGQTLADTSSGVGNESDWMTQDEQSQWNSMSPDEQYMEQLMGYPSFSSDQQASVPGSDATSVLAGGDTSGDASNQDFWSMDNMIE